MAQPEYEKVERPLIDQLVAMGWEHLQGALPGSPATRASDSGRSSFFEVLYQKRFFDAVTRLNPGPDHHPWLTDTQLGYILDRLTGHGQGQLPARGVARNLEVTRILREGINSRTLPGWTKGMPEHVRLVDWEQAARKDGDDPRGNDLLVVSQFRVERTDRTPVTPDLVLFVNGLPWGVVECKAPAVSRRDSRIHVDLAVEQVIDYAGVDAQDAVPELARFAQVLVATDGDHAELGTVTSEPRHFAPWRTHVPASEDDVHAELGASGERPLTAQEILVAGVLRPAHLLTLVRDFTTQAGRGPRTVKVVGRYQQFRAVHRIAASLRARQAARAAGRDTDQRGGVTWHTQGSGKSLTMAFLVRHLRSTPDLAGHKVVVVTDRRDLEKQIRRSLAAADERIYRSRNVRQARRFLAVDVPDVVLVMLQKARRDDTAYDGREEQLAQRPDERDRVHNRVANDAHDIVVLIDEAHRGQTAWQHARLRAMLPNAAMLGFTGTPIINRAAKTTEDIFGGFTDTYTLRDAERDRAVVPVRYAAESVSLEVLDKARLDAGFDEHIPADPLKRRRALRRFGRRKEVLESPAVIAAKAEHMMWHWAVSAMRDGFGAQVVAVSRKAAVLYQYELTQARKRLVARIDGLGPLLHDPEAEETATGEQRELLRLVRYRDLLASVEIAAVISASKGRDEPGWKLWTQKWRQDEYIERFKEGVPALDPFAPPADRSWEGGSNRRTRTPRRGARAGGPWDEGPSTATPPRERPDETAPPLGFLVVNSMLLTGFDAPPEQVLYLDRMLAGAGLLQGIARTNRPYPAKEFGLVIDYVGVGPELARSLAAYEDAHLRAVFGYEDVSFDHLDPERTGPQPTRGRLWLQQDAAAEALLADRYRILDGLLTGLGAASLDDERSREDLLAKLEDPLLRGEFDELVRDFLAALGAVLPRPYALEYEDFARRVGEVQHLLRARYLDGRDQFSPRRYGAKVRDLIAWHLKVSGIEERVPPAELTAPDFLERVLSNPDARARASYLTSRLRTHLTARLDADRTLYERFSERLEEVIRRMAEDFEQAAASLLTLAVDVRDAQDGRGGSGPAGLHPWTEQPVYGLLCRDYEEADGPAVPETVDRVKAARDVTACIAVLVDSPNFQVLPEARDRVRSELRIYLESELHVDWSVTGPMANLMVELASERHSDFLRYEPDDEA